ncbi:MAG: TraB/GumN family protein [Bacteroidetes bacterium]|nr:TraB/GumN family protein [Bacteroidota bacterium]
MFLNPLGRTLRSSLILLALLITCAPGADAQSLLWKLEGKDLPAPSYLYGTIHAICPKDMVISDTLVAAVQETKQVVLELDLDDPRLLVEMGHVSFMPRDSTLEDLYSPEDFSFLDRWFADSVGVQIKPMNNIRPLFLFGLLIGKVLECQPKSYEEVFMAMAREQEKEVIGLETPAEQLAAFSAIPLSEQADMVLAMLHDMDSTRAAFALLRDCYLSADVEQLHDFMVDSGIEYGRYDDALLTQRNQIWIPRILEIAKETPSFFALGAGHFGGEGGILSLLRAKGYRLTPVR